MFPAGEGEFKEIVTPSRAPVLGKQGCLENTPLPRKTRESAFAGLSTSSGSLIHCVYDDNAAQWGSPTGVGVTCEDDPALGSSDGKNLVCVYKLANSGNMPYYSTWTADGGWTSPLSCNNELSWGCVGLVNENLDGLCRVFPSNNDRQLTSIKYAGGAWPRAVFEPPEYSAFGVEGNGDATVPAVCFQTFMFALFPRAVEIGTIIKMLISPRTTHQPSVALLIVATI